jgi:hypothetical protein
MKFGSRKNAPHALAAWIDSSSHTDWLRPDKTGYSGTVKITYTIYEYLHMNRSFLTIVAISFFALTGCGAGETAAVAGLQAEQAKQAQQQMEQMKQQIDQANENNLQRLQQATQKDL